MTCANSPTRSRRLTEEERAICRDLYAGYKAGTGCPSIVACLREFERQIGRSLLRQSFYRVMQAVNSGAGGLHQRKNPRHKQHGCGRKVVHAALDALDAEDARNGVTYPWPDRPASAEPDDPSPAYIESRLACLREVYDAWRTRCDENPAYAVEDCRVYRRPAFWRSERERF